MLLNFEREIVIRQIRRWPRMKHRVRLERELVPGYVCRLQLDRSNQVRHRQFDCLSGQAVHHINIDIVDPAVLRLSHRANDVVAAVNSTERRQQAIVKALCSNR